MNTAALLSCQTSGRWSLASPKCLLLTLSAGVFLYTANRASSDEPPAWKRELAALQTSEATLALLPPAQAAQAPEADRRLGELFRQLAARYPHEAAVHKAAADHFWRTGETDAAMAEWRVAQELDPNDAQTASALGSAWLREGQVRLACEQFQRAVTAQPKIASYHYDLGNALYLFRHQAAGLPGLPDEATTLREALTQLRLACDLAPGNIEFARGYAETYYGVPHPDWQAALEAWEHVRNLSPESPDFALSHLARISVRLGRTQQAEGYLAAIHDPQFSQVQTELRRQVIEARKRGEAVVPRP